MDEAKPEEEKNRKFLAQDETKWQENYQFKNEDNTFEENIELMRIKMESLNKTSSEQLFLNCDMSMLS